MSGMSDARASVAAALRAGIPGLTVVEYGRQADQPDTRRVTITASAVLAPRVACPDRAYEVLLNVVTPLTEPGPADDDLDELIDQVLTVLEAAGIDWGERVERGTWLDAHHAYLITANVSS